MNSIKKSASIVWLLALVGALALVGLALPTWEVQAGITPTPTSPPTDTPVPPPTDTPAPPPTDTPAPPPTNTPKPNKDDDGGDNPSPLPPPPTETPLPILPTATPTVVLPSILPQTGGDISLTWLALVALGVLMLALSGVLARSTRAK